MQLNRITNSNSPEFKACFEIYQSSFPIFEQRALKDQIQALANRDYHFEVIQNEEMQTIGLLLTWQTSSFIYIEHFAILESARGKNVGTKVLNILKEKTQKPIILEIDPPIDEISQKRKKFYEKIGFEESGHEIIHPSYRKDTKPHKLQILALPKISNTLFEEYYVYLMDTVLYYSEL